MELLSLSGKMQSGKNRVLITRTGHRYPTERFVAWRADMSAQVRQQRAQLTAIDKPCKLTIRYWPGDLIRRDASGIMDALFHVFEHCGVVTDDALFQAIEYTQMPLDRSNPRCTVEIQEL